MSMNSIDRYKNIINSAKSYYLSSTSQIKNIKSGDDYFDFTWCPGFNQEINLWSFWQNGYRDNVTSDMSAEILLVGQDYGSYIEDGVFMPMISKCMEGSCNSTEEYVTYIRNSKKRNDTDINLLELFEVLGEEYKADIKNPRLFFTNLCLGYRSCEKISGGNISKQMKHDSAYLKELIDILRPKVVICLGALTYTCAVEGLVDDAELTDAIKKQISLIKNSFITALDSHTNHIRIECEDYGYEIFALSHPGFMGTSNRKRYTKNTSLKRLSALEILKKDWELIRKYLSEK